MFERTFISSCCLNDLNKAVIEFFMRISNAECPYNIAVMCSCRIVSTNLFMRVFLFQAFCSDNLRTA